MSAETIVLIVVTIAFEVVGFLLLREWMKP